MGKLLLIVSIGILCMVTFNVLAQQEHIIYVHFLYGSKPGQGYKSVERKWFGGKLGGHVGIEIEPDRVLNFMKQGKIHWVSNGKKKSSRYDIHTTEQFWSIFRYPAANVKRASIAIPVTQEQKAKLDSIADEYVKQTPYDYAFIGMRCAAATYEILGQLAIVQPYSFRKTYLKIFYPKKLRKRLLKSAAVNQWSITKKDGSPSRRWEND